MNKRLFVIVLLLIFSSFCVYAQKREDVMVAVIPTTGGTPEENAFFDENFTAEVAAAGYSITTDSTKADFQLVLTISTEPAVLYPETPEEEALMEKYLQITLVDCSDMHEIVSFGWAFDSLEEMYEWNLHLVYQAMANAPLTKFTGVERNDLWRHKWIYLVGCFSFAPRVYYSDVSQSGNFVSFGAAAGLEFHFLNFMSLEALFEVSYDYVVVQDQEDKAMITSIPVLLKFPIKPDIHFMISPYGGAQVNLSGNSEVTPAPVSWLVGLEYAVKAGENGGVIIDTRFGMDIGKSKALNSPKSFQRYLFNLSFGYKLGFITRGRPEL